MKKTIILKLHLCVYVSGKSLEVVQPCVFFVCFFFRLVLKPEPWTVDWTMDWTVDWTTCTLQVT